MRILIIVGITSLVIVAIWYLFASHVKNGDIVLFASKRIETLIGADKQGRLQFSKYNGRTTTLNVVVKSVQIKAHSPSIAVEDSSIEFTVQSGDANAKSLVLYFDSQNGSIPETVPNDKWTIQLNDNGELVNFQKQ
jgi:hypothetical protein